MTVLPAIDNRKKRNLELDRLRAIGLLMVIAIHFLRILFPWQIEVDYHHGGTLLHLFKNSWAGVDLFFVISGFIISKNIIAALEQDHDVLSQAARIKSFYVKRFFRLYPAAITVFVLVVFASSFFNQSGQFSSVEHNIEAGISIFTYSFNYYFGNQLYHGFALSPYWSLSVEEQFYLFFPWLIILLPIKKHRVWLFLILLLLTTFIIRPFGADNLFFTQNRADGLLYGCLLFELSRKPWYRMLLPQDHKASYGRMLVVMVLIFGLMTATAIGFSNAVNIPLVAFLSTILVGLAAMEAQFISFGAPINQLLDYLGARSYSLYLIHVPMFSLTQEIWCRLSVWQKWAIDSHLAMGYGITACTLTIIGGELLHRGIEKPLLRYGKTLEKNINGLPINHSTQTFTISSHQPGGSTSCKPI